MPVLTTLFLLTFFASPALAVTIEILPPCSSEPSFTTELDWQAGESLGAFTMRAFTKGNVNFIGSERGINSIDDSPIGMDAMEILSREEMRSYGWCFALNGRQEMAYADEVSLNSNSDKIVWTFSYAHYLRGEWLSMCNPAWKLEPDFLCKKK